MIERTRDDAFKEWMHSVLEREFAMVMANAVELHADLDLDPFYAALAELARIRPEQRTGGSR